MACDEVLLDGGDIPFAVSHSAPSTPIRGLLPKTYTPEPDEMQDDEYDRLMRSQEQVGNFLRQIGLGRRW
jgi:hypothetical protein